MSRMTKFLHQTCTWKKALRKPDGTVQLNVYGEVQYDAGTSVKCRRETLIKDTLTTNGAVLKSQTRYFVDESCPVQADDMLDGRVVLFVSEYTNHLGATEGFEIYVS